MKKALIGLLAAGTLVGCGGNTYTITGKLDPGITDSVFLSIYYDSDDHCGKNGCI